MTAKNPEFTAYEEPLLVQADASSVYDACPAVDDEDDNLARNSGSFLFDSLASQRQIQGAMWAGGITGLLVGGPIGAGLGVWGGHHFSRKGDGSIGKFVRKTGDFTSKLGRSIQREWKEASEDFRE